jgi:SRSO17 transposase
MFIEHFRTKTRSVEKQSFQYLHGKFLQKGRGDMVSYARNVPDCNSQSLQHFITHSPWDEKPVIRQIQTEVVDMIGDEVNGSLHVDESGFLKDGKHSVGVQRQYCGRFGKVDNCQVGVFLGYVNENRRILMDERLFLPATWIDDKKRREKCGVPDHITFKTKVELAWDMILDAKKNEIPFGWIGMDCLYGRASELRKQIDDEGMTYIADIPLNTRVWRERPKTAIPKKGRRGRKPTIERVVDGEPAPIEVATLAKDLDPSSFERVYLRDTERKELWSSMACLRVYPVHDTLPGKECWLIIRKDPGTKTKYQLSNAPPTTTIERLGQMSCSRYWIERAFEDAKGEVGMADYQVRSWRSWHHHMALTFLAMLYILDLSLDWGDRAPLLTVQDTKDILVEILPRNQLTEDEVLEYIKEKHRARASARRSHHRRNKS